MNELLTALMPWLIVPGILVVIALFAFMFKAFEKFMEWLENW